MAVPPLLDLQGRKIVCVQAVRPAIASANATPDARSPDLNHTELDCLQEYILDC